MSSQLDIELLQQRLQALQTQRTAPVIQQPVQNPQDQLQQLINEAVNKALSEREASQVAAHVSEQDKPKNMIEALQSAASKEDYQYISSNFGDIKQFMVFIELFFMDILETDQGKQHLNKFIPKLKELLCQK